MDKIKRIKPSLQNMHQINLLLKPPRCTVTSGYFLLNSTTLSSLAVAESAWLSSRELLYCNESSKKVEVTAARTEIIVVVDTAMKRVKATSFPIHTRVGKLSDLIKEELSLPGIFQGVRERGDSSHVCAVGPKEVARVVPTTSSLLELHTAPYDISGDSHWMRYLRAESIIHRSQAYGGKLEYERVHLVSPVRDRGRGDFRKFRTFVVEVNYVCSLTPQSFSFAVRVQGHDRRILTSADELGRGAHPQRFLLRLGAFDVIQPSNGVIPHKVNLVQVS